MYYIYLFYYIYIYLFILLSRHTVGILPCNSTEYDEGCPTPKINRKKIVIIYFLSKSVGIFQSNANCIMHDIT